MLGAWGENSNSYASDVQALPVEFCTNNGSFPQGRYFLESIGISPEGFEGFPDDLKCLIENAAMCEHYAGEEPYDEERQAEITQALDKSCSDAQRLSLSLKKKYLHENSIGKVLSVCDVGVNTSCASYRRVEPEK